MAIADRNYDSRLSYGSKVNPVVVLIGITMILFVVLTFLRALAYLRLGEDGDITGYFNKNILNWVALNADTGKAFSKPWTLLTHSFAHTNVWQLFASLIWLWCFGQILTDLTGFKKLVPLFLYGALASSAAFLLTTNTIGAGSNLSGPEYILGSAPAILAVSAAATTISPHYKIFPMIGGGIPLWVISFIYLVIDMATLPATHPTLYIAHLAGALTGFLFIFILRRGFDGSEWMNHFYDWVLNLFNPEKPHQRRSTVKSTLFYNATQSPFKKTPKLTQQKLDEILDKINQHGYENLTSYEKDFLERASREDLRNK